MARSIKMQLYKEAPHLFTDASDEGMVDLYKFISINGGTYCRAHRRKVCHQCEVDYRCCDENAEDARDRERLRPIGDRGLDRASFELDDIVSKARLDFDLQQTKYRLEHPENNGLKPGLREFATQNETRINATYLPLACTQCAWKGCTTPDKKPLFVCSRCKIVTYCCAEHQKLDYKWEHKIECGPLVGGGSVRGADSASRGHSSAQVGLG